MTIDPAHNHLSDLAEDFVEAGMNEKAAHILMAALRLFSEKGYSATTVREIVREADATNPMLYYYFESKEGVFVSLMEILIESMEESVQQVLEQEQSFEKRLWAIARAHFDACRNAPEVLRVVYSVIFGPLRSRPSYDIVASYAAIPDLVQATIEEAMEAGEFSPHRGFDSHFMAEQFMGLVGNHMMSVLTQCDHAETAAVQQAMMDEYLDDDALDLMMKFFLHGAGTVEGNR